MPGTHLRRIEAEAEELGHKITWGTIGDAVANGRCSRCGEELSVAVSTGGLRETTGAVLKARCGPTRTVART